LWDIQHPIWDRSICGVAGKHGLACLGGPVYRCLWNLDRLGAGHVLHHPWHRGRGFVDPLSFVCSHGMRPPALR
ncbi:hypothetical protein H4R34_005448, partial [Dimargaris verticillata]